MSEECQYCQLSQLLQLPWWLGVAACAVPKPCNQQLAAWHQLPRASCNLGVGATAVQWKQALATGAGAYLC
jgi:hypothetical protein